MGEELINSKKVAVISIMLIIMLLSSTFTIKAYSQSTVTTTYPEATYTVSSATTTYTSSNNPNITVKLYSDGSIKVKIYVKWPDSLPQGFLSHKEIVFYNDHVTYNYEFKSPNWEINKNSKFSYRADGKSENSVFHGHLVITYRNETDDLTVNADYTIERLNESTLIFDVNSMINGTQRIVNKTLDIIYNISNSAESLKIENLAINRQDNIVQLKMKILMNAYNGITMITSSTSLFLLPILGDATPISPSLIDKAAFIHVEANLTNSTFTMKQSGEYTVGYKEFLNSIVDTFNKTQNANSEPDDIAKLLHVLLDNFETSNGEKFVYIMNSTGQLIILPKMKKTGSSDPLETLIALRDSVLKVIPEDETEYFLNTTIKLEPGDSNIRNITPDIVKLVDLDSVEVDISSSSNKYLGVASAMAIFAVIVVAIILIKKIA